MKEEILSGGIANAGAVVRIGPHVLRPTHPYTASVHRMLRWSRDRGFEGAPEVVRIDSDGRERLVFIEGDVPLPPYPDWAQTDRALASVTALLRELHRSTAAFDQVGACWSRELASAQGGPVICHNDVCLENVVFRDGLACALLDFDFAAPGEPVHDLANFAKMCVPIDDELNATRNGWRTADRPARLRLVADTYGLDQTARIALMDALNFSMEHGANFVRRRVEAGDPNFIAMWNDMGGEERYRRRLAWWLESRHEFARKLGL